MCRMKELKGLMTFSKLSHPNIMKVGVTRWPVVDVHYERIVWKGHIRHLVAGGTQPANQRMGHADGPDLGSLALSLTCFPLIFTGVRSLR